MKKLFNLTVAIFLAAPAFAGNDPIPVKSEIREVTVFLAGAQVTRTASVNIEEGTQILVFGGLPQNLKEESIQVKGTGNFTILSVTSSSDSP